MNDELGSIWKETVFASCKTISVFVWGIEENHETLESVYTVSGPRNKAGPKKYEVGVLTTRHSVRCSAVNK
jgi:hypothetical protein